MSVASALLENGASVVNRLYYSQKDTVAPSKNWFGFMGLKLDNFIYHLELSAYKASGLPITKEEVLNKLDIVKIDALDHPCNKDNIFKVFGVGATYNAKYHILVTHDKVLLHRKGWFRNKDLGNHVHGIKNKLKGKYDLTYTQRDEDDLLRRGFEIIFE